jgi:riboflavin kinase / FMN adenylyltransferase
MRIIKGIGAALPDEARGTVVAIGKFDGVHRGHQNVLALANAKAKTYGTAASVLTFDPHPTRFFFPDRPASALSSPGLKYERIARQGVRFTFVQKFSRSFSEISAEDFVLQTLVGRLGVRHVVVGEDYRFGHRRQGDVDLLQRLGRQHGFGVTAAAQCQDDRGRVLSSSRIRVALAEGRPHEAHEILGQPWEIDGLARLQCHRSFDLDLGDLQRPAEGFYQAKVALDRGNATCWNGAADAIATVKPDREFVSVFQVDAIAKGWPLERCRIRLNNRIKMQFVTVDA